MDIQKMTQDGKTVLQLSGALDTNTAPALESALAPELAAQADIVIDLAATEYISSAGLRVLLSAHKTLVGKGGTLTVKSPNEMAKELFQMTGFDTVLTIE